MSDRLQILTEADSKRVADALIAKTEEADFDFANAVGEAIDRLVQPQTENRWKRDWFPLTVEDMCDSIKHGVVAAAYESAQRQRKGG